MRAKPFAGISDHVLLPIAGSVAEADERLAPRLTEDGGARGGRAPCPPDWLDAERYVEYLMRRLAAPRGWVP